MVVARRHAFSPRDAILLLVGATIMHLYGVYTRSSPEITINASSGDVFVDSDPLARVIKEKGLHDPVDEFPITVTKTVTGPNTEPYKSGTGLFQDTPLPTTDVEHHAPGWTLFHDVYMSNGTLFVVTDRAPSSFPEKRMMISTSMYAFAEEENIKAREPTEYTLDFISPAQAKERWKGGVSMVNGMTVLVNEPAQFLNHYYHLIAELWFGSWIFWTGAHRSVPPLFDRIIFAYAPSTGDGWRDKPGFNSWFLRGVFPSLAIEDEDDWQDRIRITSDGEKAFHFPRLLLTDRSAAHRGRETGSLTQRIAAEAWEYMKGQNRLALQGKWWDPIRHAVWKYAGVTTQKVDEDRIVITYVSRQSTARRKLIPGDHDVLVREIEKLVRRKGKKWEFNIMEAEKLTKEEQIRITARTTILLGVHGNGLTHLVFLPHHPRSAVIEMFYPEGFAHDYQWTSKSLGLNYRAVWNDTSRSHKDKPNVAYPEGFQLNAIPVHGPYVAKLIEDIADDKL